MCILCELKKSLTKQELDMSKPAIAYAVRILGKEEAEANLLDVPGESLTDKLKAADEFSKRVIEAGEKKGLTYDKFLVEFYSQARNKVSNRYAAVKTPMAGQTSPRSSVEFLNNAERLQRNRAAEYDQPEGERSMGKTVAAFNTITGHNLSETDAWLMMTLLKAVRANQGEFKSDNYEDLVSYAALLAESAVKEQGN